MKNPLEAAEKAARDAERERLQEDHDLKVVLEAGNGAGLRVMQRLLNLCGLADDPFDMNAGKMGYNCGQQRVGKMIERAIFRADHNAWLKLKQLGVRQYLETT